MKEPDTASTSTIRPPDESRWHRVFRASVPAVLGAIVGGVATWFGNWMLLDSPEDRKQKHAEAAAAEKEVLEEEHRKALQRMYLMTDGLEIGKRRRILKQIEAESSDPATTAFVEVQTEELRRAQALLDKQLDDANNEATTSEQDIDAVRAALESARSRSAQSTAAAERLKKEVEAKERRIAELRNQATGLGVSSKEAAQEIEKLEGQIATMRRSHKELENEKAGLDREIKEKQKKIASLRQQLEAAKKRVRELEQQAVSQKCPDRPIVRDDPKGPRPGGRSPPGPITPP